MKSTGKWNVPRLASQTVQARNKQINRPNTETNTLYQRRMIEWGTQTRYRSKLPCTSDGHCFDQFACERSGAEMGRPAGPDREGHPIIVPQGHEDPEQCTVRQINPAGTVVPWPRSSATGCRRAGPAGPRRARPAGTYDSGRKVRSHPLFLLVAPRRPPQ